MRKGQSVIRLNFVCFLFQKKKKQICWNLLVIIYILLHDYQNDLKESLFAFEVPSKYQVCVSQETFYNFVSETFTIMEILKKYCILID